MAYGWHQEKMAESAREVSELGKVLYDRILSLANHFASLGSSLDRAVDSYNKALGSLENRVLSTVRKFPELGVITKEEISTASPVDKHAREIQAPDLVEKDLGEESDTGGAVESSILNPRRAQVGTIIGWDVSAHMLVFFSSMSAPMWK